MLSVAVGALLAITFLELYRSYPRCPECHSIRAVVDRYDGRIRVCRQCLNIYVVRR